MSIHAKTRAMIDQANAILEEYAKQGFTLTLRQLFYQFVARQLVANDDREYGRLGRTMTDARRGGRVDWDYIEDRTREIETFAFWEGPADIVAAAADGYRENLWLGQKYRPEVFIEKTAFIGVIEPACRRWRVPHMALRGYNSHSELYAAGKRFWADHENGLRPIVFHLGDHDPSGLDMTRSLREELSLYARYPVRVDRIGLNLEQIHSLDLPPNPAKETDKRYAEYVRATRCSESWELDALSPSIIDGLVDKAVCELIDFDVWREAAQREEQGRERLQRAAELIEAGHGGTP
jgi:hypothetical protein